MEYVALVTLLLILQYIVFMGFVGKARVETGIQAPATTGDPAFERAYRVHINTLEQLAITLPAMWISAYYFSPTWAAGLGLMFFLGRVVYRNGYVAAPEKRSLGMGIGFLANIGLLGTALWGVVGKLL